MNELKPYKLIKHYTKNNLTRTYEQYIMCVECAYKSIRRLIESCESYSFDRHKIIINTTEQIITIELYDQLKPRFIPLNEVIFAQNDPKLIIR